MPRTCESIARLKTNSAQSAVMYSILRCQMARTCVNTTVLVPEGGWIKRCYLRGFIHVTIFNFLKNVNTSVFYVHQGKKSVQQMQKCCNLQGFGTKWYHHGGKIQRPKVANTLLFTVFRAFHVFLTFQRPCKYQHFLRSTRQKFCNYNVFCLAFQNTGLCSVLCISGQKSIGIYSTAFLHFSRKRR